MTASDCVQTFKPATCVLKALTPGSLQGGAEQALQLVWRTGPRAGELVQSGTRTMRVRRPPAGPYAIVRGIDYQRAAVSLEFNERNPIQLSASGRGIDAEMADRLNQTLTCDHYDWLPRDKGAQPETLFVNDWTRERAAANFETSNQENRVAWAAQGVQLVRQNDQSYRIASVGFFVGNIGFPAPGANGEKYGWTLRKDKEVCEVFFESANVQTQGRAQATDFVELSGPSELKVSDIPMVIMGTGDRRLGPFAAELNPTNRFLLGFYGMLWRWQYVQIGPGQSAEVLVERELD